MSRYEDSEFFTEWMGSDGRDQKHPEQTGEQHGMEAELASLLNAKAGVDFDRLVVRRLPNNSVCLEGSMTLEGDDFDIEDYIKCLTSVETVINRLSVRKLDRAVEETITGEETL